MFRIFAPLIVTFATAVLVACSPPSSTRPASGAAGAAASSAAQPVTVQGTDALKFEPSTLTVKAGQPITLTFANSCQTVRDWTLTQGAAHPVKITAAGGQRASATFTNDRPVSYTFICSQPGHEAGGMKGTITAQ